MASFIAFIVFRAHYAISQVVGKRDQLNEARGILAQDDFEDLQRFLPHLVELQQHLIELEQSRASVRRLNALAREKELANVKKDRLQRRRQIARQLQPVLSKATNGEPVNRLVSADERAGLN